MDLFSSSDPSQYDGDPNTSNAAGVTPDFSLSAFLPGDVADAQQMAPWNPPAAQQQGVPWWGGIAAYGITKAIDNQFPGSPTGIWGNTYPGSVIGPYNGRSYTLQPTGAGGSVMAAGVGMRGNPLMLLALVAVAVVLLK